MITIHREMEQTVVAELEMSVKAVEYFLESMSDLRFEDCPALSRFKPSTSPFSC